MPTPRLRFALLLTCSLTSFTFTSPRGRAATDDGVEQRILAVAQKAAVRQHEWKQFGEEDVPGHGPIGYTKGMALAYADAYRRLKRLLPDAYVKEMARPVSAGKPQDALYVFRARFAALGMPVEAGGVETLRALFTLLYEMGLRESDGQYDEGIDTGENKPRTDIEDPASTAEAGLFQSSWNFAEDYPLLRRLYADYATGKKPGLGEVFREGMKPKRTKDHGGGDGAKFQRLAKDNPAFAVEYAALSVRDQGEENYHFIHHRHLEISPKAAELFRQVEVIVDAE